MDGTFIRHTGYVNTNISDGPQTGYVLETLGGGVFVNNVTKILSISVVLFYNYLNVNKSHVLDCVLVLSDSAALSVYSP